MGLWMKIGPWQGCGMESEEELRMGSGEHPYFWKRQRLNHPGRETEK